MYKQWWFQALPEDDFLSVHPHTRMHAHKHTHTHARTHACTLPPDIVVPGLLGFYCNATLWNLKYSTSSYLYWVPVRQVAEESSSLTDTCLSHKLVLVEKSFRIPSKSNCFSSFKAMTALCTSWTEILFSCVMSYIRHKWGQCLSTDIWFRMQAVTNWWMLVNL